jgi:pentatricopeptide repeat protein
MASLLLASAALARRVSSSHVLPPRTLGAAVAAASPFGSIFPPSTLTPTDARGIATSRVLAKRLGGHSAFVVKSSKFRKKSMKKKDKLKRDTAPHKTHVESMRALKERGRENERNEQLWEQLEGDDELNKELDNVFEYLNNLGPEGDYVYEPDASLADLDEKDVLAKLNALARGDRAVLDEVQHRLAEEGEGASETAHELSVDDYNLLMRVYAEKGLFDKANVLLTRMEKNCATPPDATLVTATAASPSEVLATTDDAELLALDFVPHRIAPDYNTYMYYIVSLVHAGASGPAQAVRTLGRMKEHGVQPELAVYNSVMNVCAKAGKVQWAYNIMEKMQLAGFTPDKASFTILMHAAISEGDVDKAFKTFHLMRSRVTEPDVVAFTVLINGYAKIGRIERAINLYEDLLDCGLTPTHMTFNALILACAKSHYFAHKAVEFYHEMHELYDYRPDPFSYHNVLHACAKQGDVIQAEEILRHMRKHKVPITDRTISTMLNVYARAQIKRVVRQAPRNKKPLPPLEEIRQDPLEYDEDGREIDLTRPFKQVTSMENWNYDGVQDDDDDEEEEYDGQEYDSDEAMEAASRQGDLTAEERQQIVAIRAQDALALTEDPSVDDPLTLRAMDLSDFGRFQTENISRAEQLLDEFVKGPHADELSVVTLTSMLSVYANALRLGRAEHFFQEAFPKHSVEPNVHTFRVLMQMYTRARRTPKAETLFEEYKQKVEDGTMAADAIMVGMLVDHYARHRFLRKALVLLEQADDMGALPLAERHYKKVRRLTEKFGLFTELIPEDPYAVITAGTRHKLLEKRKVRAEVIAFNKKTGRKFLLPASVKQ